MLFFGGLTDIAEGEGYDRESFDLPSNQTALFKQLLEANEQIGFISVSGSPYDMELPSRCKALLQLYLGGEAVGAACAKIVLGIVNPSGKLAETIPYRETDVPSYGYFGTQGEQSRHLDDVEYRESLFVGYRYYDTFHVPVRYCFGYGLSYTDFVYSDLQVTETQNQNYRVTFSVENRRYRFRRRTSVLSILTGARTFRIRSRENLQQRTHWHRCRTILILRECGFG